MGANGDDLWRNPFLPTWVERFFVGREDELGSFKTNLSALKEEQQSHILVCGVHGTGKSFYLRKLVEIAKAEGLVALVADCPEGAPLDQAKAILLCVIREFEEQAFFNKYQNKKEFSEDFNRGQSSKYFSLANSSILGGGNLQYDLAFLVREARAAGKQGIFIAIDEGQRSSRVLLSAIKNEIGKVPGVLLVLSWRLASDARGAVQQARDELLARVSDTEGDKDIGAASFFATATPMGPFKNEGEVRSYFQARLAGNAVSFSADVLSGLAEIANRVPRPMTDLAHDVYEMAMKLRKKHVDVDILEECFRSRYAAEMKRATSLCADLAHDALAIVRGLCGSPGPVTALELVHKALPNTPTALQPMMADAVSLQLEKLCSLHSAIRKDDDKYGIADSFSRYAIKIVASVG